MRADRRLALCFLLWLGAGLCHGEWHNDSQSIMGTEVSVSLWHGDAEEAGAAIAAVMEEMHRIDALWNPDRPTSELYRVNAGAARAPVAISSELTTLVEKALYYSELSGGAFDISFASVGRYYDYRAGSVPEADQLAQALPAIDYRLIELDSEGQLLAFGHPAMQLDLGGIAKGYAVERALDILRERRIVHAAVSAGGDTGLLGDRRGRPWMVGIRNPRGADEADVALALPLENLAFSTSGDYERFFISPAGQERVHHIINPSTGKSSQGITSVSVVGPRAFDTDPLSTTVFVLGLEQGLALVDQLPGYDAIIIDSKGVVHYSSGLVE